MEWLKNHPIGLTSSKVLLKHCILLNALPKMDKLLFQQQLNGLIVVLFPKLMRSHRTNCCLNLASKNIQHPTSFQRLQSLSLSLQLLHQYPQYLQTNAVLSMVQLTICNQTSLRAAAKTSSPQTCRWVKLRRSQWLFQTLTMRQRIISLQVLP